MASSYLYEIRIHEKQREDITSYSMTFHGEKRMLQKMIELATKDTAFLVYKEATKWKKLLFRHNYLFSIQDVPAKDSPYPYWSLAEILKGQEVVELPAKLNMEYTAKALQEELMGYAAKIASRQGNLFR
ncbi:hypothetical protein MHH70_01215 [Metasolibacillus sp. FSL H7-0170]|uniref:hypothetical protein n=1 Tax=Metasolibacillus TaxID=2703677 RepID=UPI00079AD40A|nr:hypothetical protein [Metasolibacillus fluoroglycofenilyticus]KYG91717.1 hypothetical protein A0U40_01885 [[Bacillus] sp. KCTC 13219]